MARRHAAVLAARPEVELSCLVSTERSREAAQALANEHSIPKVTTNLDEVLDHVDLVYVCTADDSHVELVTTALRAEKAVFCEKPLARSADGFSEIGAALEAAQGVALQVGMNCRFRRFAEVQRLVAGGSLGALRLLRGTYLQNLVASVKTGAKPWMRRPPAGVDQFLHGGAIHCLDLMRWIGGDVASVFARTRSDDLSPDWPCDTVSVSLEFLSGALGEFVGSATAFGPRSFELQAWLSEGSIVDDEVHCRRGDGSDMPPERLAPAPERLDLDLQLDDLLASIHDGTEPLNSFGEALANYGLIAAIAASATDGMPVSLDSVAVGGAGRGAA